jgi:hypothetical protein
MKIRLLCFIAIAIFLNKSFCQWNNLHTKDGFTFSLSRVKMDNNSKNILATEKKSLSVILDTIINIQNRKMFVFNKCLNGLLFNSSVELIKGKIKDKDYGSLDALYGVQLIDGQQDFSDKQITVFYQVDSFIYVITMPQEFKQNVLKKYSCILKIDSLIMSDVIDTSSPGYMKNYNILFANYNIPVSQLLVISNQAQEYDSKSDYPLYFLAEIKKETSQDDAGSMYVYKKYRRAVTIGQLFFDTNWLFHSESLAYTKQYTYRNIVDVKKN